MNQNNVYEMVTDTICKMLEQGFIPWQRPWSNNKTNMAWSRLTNKPYSFINHLLLANPEKKYKTFEDVLNDVSGEWLTFNQIKELGGSVKKGEKARLVIFFKWLEKTTDRTNENGNEIIDKIPCLQRYFVFKTTQCEGIEQKYNEDDGTTYDFTENKTAEEVANEYLTRENIEIRNDNLNKTFYHIEKDYINMPKKEQFRNAEEYYSTLFHEITHSTGNEKRLDRLKNGILSDGEENYSLEELTAEIGSASILATLKIDTSKTLRNSAAYIQSWLKVLRNDKKMIVFASARAEKAIRYIFNFNTEVAV